MDINLAVNLLGSATSGMIARFICHPIDTIKSKLQSGKPEYHNFASVITTTLRKEGVVGFYRGVGAVIYGGIPGVSIYLTSYDQMKATLSQNQNLPLFSTSFISGMFAEIISCIVFVPVDVVKERLQVQSPKSLAAASSSSSTGNNSSVHTYSSSYDAFTKILKTEGLRGIYKGYNATLLSYGPYSALYFMFYEISKDNVLRLNRQDITRATNDAKHGQQTHLNKGSHNYLSFNQSLFCAAISGAIASFVTSPLDMAKLRMQIYIPSLSSDSNSHGESVASMTRPGMVSVLRTIYSQEGIRGLFRGALARVLFQTPSAAIIMTLYEECKRFWSSVLIK